MGLSWQQGPLAPGAIGRKPLPGIAGGLPTSRNPSVESRKTAKSSLNGGSWRRCVSNSRVWLCEHRWLNVRCIEIQICHAAQVKKHALANTYNTKEYVLANGAPSHDAGTLHVDMCLGKTLSCAAVRTLSFCGCKVQGEYLAQFAGGSITVKVVVGVRTHFRSPVGPKRSVLILSRPLPEAIRRSVAPSTNDVGPQT